MFNRKKLKKLEYECSQRFTALDNKVAVLDFKLKAKENKFIIEPLESGAIRIQYLSELESEVLDKIISYKNTFEVIQKGDYIECWVNSWTGRYLDRVMRVDKSRLVDMDVRVYEKAFYKK